MRKLLPLLVLMLASASAYAGGYRVSIQGQKQMAMGHTGVAVVNSSEILFFNPAGLNFLESKLNVSVGATGIFADVAWQNDEFGQSSSTDNGVGTPVSLYATYKINDWLAAGLGIYTPYGSSVEWPTDWTGSHLVNNIDLSSIFIQPTVAIRINKHLSFGLGGIMSISGVEFNRNLNRTLADSEGNRSNVTIEDTGIIDFGYSVGMMFKPTEDLTIGINYRSEIEVESEDGTANFENIPNSSLTPFPAETGFTAALPLPAELTVGLSYQYQKWLFAFDYNRAFWNSYEALVVDFEAPTAPTSVNPRNYKNASTYRFGVQYDLNEKIVLRAGYYFDESPVQATYFAPETPRNDSHGFTGGFSYNFNDKWALDASFLYLRFEEVDASYDFYQENGQNVPFSGTYKSSVFAPGLGVTYKM